MIADFAIIDGKREEAAVSLPFLLTKQISLFTFAEKAPRWPGVALLLQNVFIFFSSLLYKFGRTSGDDVPYGF